MGAARGRTAVAQSMKLIRVSTGSKNVGMTLRRPRDKPWRLSGGKPAPIDDNFAKLVYQITTA